MQRQRDFSRRAWKIVLISLFLTISPGGLINLTGQDVRNPEWVDILKGQRAFEEGDLGEALTLFENIVTEDGTNPEAEYWIGRIYHEEGEFELAESQYKKALEMYRYFYIPTMRYTVLYQLSKLYLDRRQPEEYEAILLSVYDDEVSSTSENVRKEHAYIKNLTIVGLNKVIYLYRLDLTFSLRSAHELGVYYYKTGNYKGALLKNLYSVMAVFSHAIKVYRKEAWDFEFPDTESQLIALDEDYYYAMLKEKNKKYDGISYCLDMFNKQSEIARYLEKNEFYKSLYYLGLSLHALGYTERGRELWDYMRNREEAGVWKELAQAQYLNPALEGNVPVF